MMKTMTPEKLASIMHNINDNMERVGFEKALKLVLSDKVFQKYQAYYRETIESEEDFNDYMMMER